MKHIKLLLSSVLSFLLMLSCTTKEQQPNIVHIVIDDLGWRDLGCYGSTFYETPNIDRLADDGMLFTDAYSSNPTCSPTRSSLLTGLYPVRTGLLVPAGHLPGIREHNEHTTSNPDHRAAIPSSVNFLDPEYHTLGEAMKEAGYATAFLGKWHLGHPPYIPENNGFDFVVGGRHHPGPPGKDRERQFFPPWDAETLPQDVPADTHIDDYLAERAADYIASHKDEPLFMCFWTYSVHVPIQSKPELVEKWKKKVDLNNPQHCATMAAMIEVVDGSIGRVLQSIKECGLEENTIVILTSDNGGNMYNNADGTTATNNYPLRAGKGTNYMGGVRIPLIVRWPHKVKAGSVNHDIVSAVDHFPTILEMTGQELLPDVHKDGVSFLPALKGKKHDRGSTICDRASYARHTHCFPSTYIQTGDWKLLRFWFDNPDQTHRYELYNVKEDISESNNLARDYPEKVKDMSNQLDDFYAETGCLQPNANEAYNGRTLGVWVLGENGEGSITDGVMSFESNADDFTVTTRAVPFVDDGAIFEFEARSEKNSPLTLQWRAGSGRNVGEFNDQKAQYINLSPEWNTYRLQLAYKNRLTGLRFFIPDKNTNVEIRHARILTVDGSETLKYQFN